MVGRKRIYKDHAERQRAYRRRHLSPKQKGLLMRLFRDEPVFLVHESVGAALIRKGLIRAIKNQPFQSPFRLTPAGADVARSVLHKHLSE